MKALVRSSHIKWHKTYKIYECTWLSHKYFSYSSQGVLFGHVLHKNREAWKWVSTISRHAFLCTKSPQPFIDHITFHYKVYLPHYKLHWPYYKCLLTSLQNFIYLITNFYWLHYKTLLKILQTFTDLITKVYLPHYKFLLTSLQTFIDFITKLYWPHY